MELTTPHLHSGVYQRACLARDMINQATFEVPVQIWIEVHPLVPLLVHSQQLSCRLQLYINDPL